MISTIISIGCYIILNTKRIEETVIPMIRNQFIFKVIDGSYDYILKEIQELDDLSLK